MQVTLWDVGRMFGVKIPALGGAAAECPFRDHRKRKRNFRVFSSKDGTPLYKCWSCDPPGNVGDAVGLFSRLANITRAQACKELRERGYEVPGGRSFRGDDVRSSQPRRSYVKPVPSVPVNGDRTSSVLNLPKKLWQTYRDQRNGAVVDFARARGLDEKLLRDHDVLDVDHGVVGFGYRNPSTGMPCRVKCRALEDKRFWIYPKPKEGEQGKALAPLYLAHDLDPFAPQQTVVIVEGEVDALTLRKWFRNVVSLPDGASSASRVDLLPIARNCACWLVATDADADGHKAYLELMKRARPLMIPTYRVEFCKLYEQDTGEELVRYKDANEACLQGGFSEEDFRYCFELAQAGADTVRQP